MCKFLRGIQPQLSSLLVADDDDAHWTTPNINLGEIQIDIKRIEILRAVAREKSKIGGYMPPEHQKVHEKSKKSGTHRVG